MIKFYLKDLRTDLRRPASWLDFTNQLLRRVLLILVRHEDEATGEQWMALYYWPSFYRRITRDE